MEIRGLRDIEKIVNDLRDRSHNLLDSLAGAASISDIYQIIEYQGKLSIFCFIIIRAESNMYQMMYDIEDMNLDKEIYEKVLFVINKHLNSYIQDLLLAIENIISIRDSEFDDYRARDWQMDVARKMEIIRDYYKKTYNLD